MGVIIVRQLLLDVATFACCSGRVVVLDRLLDATYAANFGCYQALYFLSTSHETEATVSI